MDYAWHEIAKGVRVIILPPSIDEVLENNFNYPDYIKKYLIERQKIDDEYLTKLYYREISEDEIIDEGKPLRNMLIELGLNDDFEREIIQIQKIYEDDLKEKKATLDYNNEMKLIAQKYYDILQKSANKDSDNILKQKELIAAKERLNDYQEGKISFGKLYISDLQKVKRNEIKVKDRKRLIKNFQTILYALQSEEGIYDKKVEELNLRRKRK